MTINITGPKKYDFQDIACVAIGLQALRQPGTELLIEPRLRNSPRWEAC